MTILRTTIPGLGGSISIGDPRDADQDPTPDGETLPEDDDDAPDVKREPDPVPEDAVD